MSRASIESSTPSSRDSTWNGKPAPSTYLHKLLDVTPEVSRIDTGYMRTYTVGVNVTLSIDEQLVTRARKKADALGKSLNQLIRDYLQRLAGGDDPERSIEEFKRLSGRGHSRGWRFNRNQIHERS